MLSLSDRVGLAVLVMGLVEEDSLYGSLSAGVDFEGFCGTSVFCVLGSICTVGRDSILSLNSSSIGDVGRMDEGGVSSFLLVFRWIISTFCCRSGSFESNGDRWEN